MSKKIIIPYGKCLSLTPNINGVKKIDKINYNDKAFKKQMQLAFSFTLLPYIIGYSDNGTIKITENTDYLNNEYVDGVTEYDYSSSSTMPRKYALTSLKIDITNYMMQYSDLANAYIEFTRTKYSKVIGSSSDFDVETDTLRAINKSAVYITTGLKGGYFEVSYENGKYYLVLSAGEGSIFFTWYQDLRSSVNTYAYYNYDVNVYLPLHTYIDSEQTITNSNGSIVYNVGDNEFTDSETTYGGVGIARNNATAIANYYKTNKTTIESTIILADYYDEDGNLVINKTNGEIVEVGDEVKFIGNKKELFDNKYFKITSSEFDYNGVPKLIIKGKEIINVRLFTVSLTNPEWMTVNYSYTNLVGTLVSGTISSTTTFTDVAPNSSVTISASPISQTAQYDYTVSTSGGTYAPNISSVEIIATRTLRSYQVTVGIKDGISDEILESQIINVDYGHSINSATYYNDDTYQTNEYNYSNKTTNSIVVHGTSEVYTVYNTRTQRLYDYTIEAYYLDELFGEPIATISGTAAYNTTINPTNVFYDGYVVGNKTYYDPVGNEMNIVSDDQVIKMHYNDFVPNGQFSISNTTINRGVEQTLVSNNLFADYRGYIEIDGKIYTNMSNGNRNYILGSASGNGRMTLPYDSIAGGWTIYAYDEAYEDEDDYTEGYAILKVDSNGVHIEWNTYSYNAYTINSIFVGASYVKAVRR